jgi:hypothetical protein
MSRVPSDFKVTNVKRAIAAARAAGESVDRVDIAKDGRISLILARESQAGESGNDWDRALAKSPAKVRSRV